MILNDKKDKDCPKSSCNGVLKPATLDDNCKTVVCTVCGDSTKRFEEVVEDRKPIILG